MEERSLGELRELGPQYYLAADKGWPQEGTIRIMSEKKRLPQSNFGKSVGDDIVLYLSDAEDLEPLGLPIEGGRLTGRLVGVDKPGVWIEPKAWFDKAVAAEEPVQHVFIKWDNVLGLTRPLDAELFGVKKEYRGLRPRN